MAQHKFGGIRGLEVGCVGLDVDRCGISMQVISIASVHSITLYLQYPNRKIPSEHL